MKVGRTDGKRKDLLTLFNLKLKHNIFRSFPIREFQKLLEMVLLCYIGLHYN